MSARAWKRRRDKRRVRGFFADVIERNIQRMDEAREEQLLILEHFLHRREFAEMIVGAIEGPT